MDVVAMGELLIDFSCREKNADNYPIMEAHPGGAPANFLSAVQKFGKKTAFIGKVGNDTFGHLLEKTLKDNGISTKGLVIDDKTFTTLAFVTFNEQNDREFSFARKPGADTQLKKSEINKELIDSAKVFHFGTLSLTDNPSRKATKFAVAYAKKHGKLISFDPNLREPLWNDLNEARKQICWGLGKADVVKISDNEVKFLFGDISYEDAAKKILDEYKVKLVYITLGKDGCLYANKQCMGTVPGLKGLKVRDTTGAGDIFGGSAMYALLKSKKDPEALKQKDLEKIVKFACTSAGLSTTKEGGISSVPSLKEVEEKIK